MRFSKFFAPTIKEVPKECVLKSHIYMLRAGFIHQIGSGIYNFLPLGKRVLDKIRSIIKKRMDESGSSEVVMGFLTPLSLWEKSGRAHKYSELAVFTDRKDSKLVLCPTNEECVTEIAKSYVKSYKQLPLSLYQIHLKFRDEMRPRSGLLRAREFVMKDAYSFHSSVECLDREFENMRETYIRIFKDFGLDFRVIEADSGAIGGSGSREFNAIADCGDDIVVTCPECNYASNVEAATRKPKISESTPPQASKPYHKFPTPGVKTIQDLSDFFNIDTYFLIKAVVKKAVFKNRDEIIVFFMRGLDKLEPTKALNAIKRLDSEVLDIVEAEGAFLEKYKLPQGSIGPIHLGTLVGGGFIVFDSELRDSSDLICGANEDGYHYVGVDLGEFENLVYADLLEVQQGDSCAVCGGGLVYKRGIEIGHIFKLGDRYSSAMNANFLDSNGQEQPFIMGCYGIGITRLMSAILEQRADDRGCVWGCVSPFKLDIIISNIKDPTQKEIGESLYDRALKLGIEVILDDRAERFGVKINDFELIGFEYALIVGKKLEQGKVELIKRDGLKREEIGVQEVFLRF